MNRTIIKVVNDLDKDIIVQISYPSNSRLKARLKMIDRLREEMYK